MKLFEDMEAMGGTINDVVQKVILDMFGQEMDESEVERITAQLSLTDLLKLDTAYTKGNKEAVSAIIGPLPAMEYSMGPNRQVSSNASERPAPKSAKPAQAGNQNDGGGKPTGKYSGGVQNGVSTTNIDNEDDPEQMVTDPEEELEESGLDYNPAAGEYNHQEQWNDADLRELAKEFQSTMAGQGHRDENDIIDDMLAIAPTDVVDNIINDVYAGMDEGARPVPIPNPKPQLKPQPNLKPDLGETNIVEMQSWLQRRAGIDK
jgi:hypothetical protein